MGSGLIGLVHKLHLNCLITLLKSLAPIEMNFDPKLLQSKLWSNLKRLGLQSPKKFSTLRMNAEAFVDSPADRLDRTHFICSKRDGRRYPHRFHSNRFFLSIPPGMHQTRRKNWILFRNGARTVSSN